MSASTSPTSPAPLSRVDRWIIAALCLVVVGFGALTLQRGAYLKRRQTDAGVFFRAGWAVREGKDLYSITDNNGWHYIYPSLFAVAMVPLADPPKDESRAESLPYAVSVVIWYVIGAAGVLGAAHAVARTLEVGSARAIAGGQESARSADLPSWRHRAWWTMRAWPIVAFAPDIGSTLVRGQTNGFLVLGVALAGLALVRGRRIAAGVWIAVATVIKVIPAFFVVYAAWTRNWRMMIGFAVGLVLGLLVIPAAIIGPKLAWQYNLDWLRVVGLPGLDAGTDTSRAEELHDMRGNSNQAPQAVLYNWTYLNVPDEQAPADADKWMKVVHGVFGLAMTGATLVVIGGFGWRRASTDKGTGGLAASGTVTASGTTASGTDGLRVVLAMGMLTQAMLWCSPVTHVHYMMMLMPTVAGLLWAWGSPGADGHTNRRGLILVGVCVVALVLPKVGEPFDVLRKVGWIPAFGLVLWSLAAREVWKLGRTA